LPAGLQPANLPAGSRRYVPWYNSPHVTRILRITLIVVLTVVFLALFLWNSNLRDVWRILLTTNPAWFAIGLIINGSVLIFRTVRWRILLNASDPPAFYPTFLANAIGYMLSTVLPIRAGDVARPALLSRRTNIRFSEALGTVLTERVLDLLSILSIFLFFCAYHWTEFNHPVVRAGAYTAGAMLVGLTVMILAFRFSQGAVRRLHAWLGGFLPQRFREPWMRFFDAFAATLRITERPSAFIAVLVTTACIWFCLTSQFWFVLAAAHRPLPFDASLFLNAATTVGIAIPTPGGIGGFHKVCQWVLTTFYGFDIDTSVAVAVLFHIVGTLPVVLVGAVLFLREGLNWRQLKQETHAEQT
jgi:glycosyltransferase 2 family protein